MKTEEKIEHLIGKNSDSFEIAKVIKGDIKEYLNSLNLIFEQTQGKDFLVKHTKMIDSFINIIYKYVLRDFFGYYMPMRSSIPITVVALGSYGREQLCVYSDIDLMVVYKPTKGYNLLPIVESIMQMAWDSGMKIGHRVHQIDELFEASNSDVTIKTAFLEARFLTGSKPLWFHIEQKLQKIREYKQKEFIDEKLIEHKKRTQKYKLTMQPNIKEAQGGLRDMNSLFWFSKTLYGVDRIRDLEAPIIQAEEYKEIRKAVEFLYRVRSALHLSYGKKIDTLTLDRIYEVSKKLGFCSKKRKTAEVLLTQKLLKDMWIINVTSNILMRKVIKNIIFDKKNIKKFRENRIEKNLYLCNNRLFTSFWAKPKSLQEILNQLFNLKNLNVNFDISYINLIKNNSNPHCDNQTIKTLFGKPHIYKLLFAFFRAGMLVHLIPPLKPIINLAQFDGYHQYPVDIHLLYTVKYLENIKDERVLKVYNSFDNSLKMLLKLVALMHDCGKGKTEDHSIAGAKIFKTYGCELGLDENLIEIGYLLILHHTKMSNVAQRKDIYNENVILHFASLLKSAIVLKMLFVLTYADMNAVGDNVYKNFNANLIYELFNNTLEYINNRVLMGETEARMKKEIAIKKDGRFLNFSRLKQKKILSITSNLFFVKKNKNTIFDIMEFVEKIKNGYVYRISNTKSLTIQIARDASLGLNIAYLLGRFSKSHPNLEVGTIDIFKLYDEIKYFKIEFSKKVDEFELEYIEEIITNSFDMTKKIKLKKPIIKQGELEFNCNHSKTYATMNTNIQNQKGLIAYIVQIFDNFKIDIASTKIQTIKGRAINLFLIEKNGNFCANKEKIWDMLLEDKG